MIAAELNYFSAVVLGVVEGLTEYLPVSSTGHLTFTEKLLGLRTDDPAVTAYTAIIQVGAIAATLLYFWKDIARLFMAWVRGLRDKQAREHQDWTLAWAVIFGSIPVGIVGFLLKDVISGPLRTLWVFAIALILWSVVMWVAEKAHARMDRDSEVRDERAMTVKDGIIMGLVQCFSLIPGVSRSGATISAGLLLKLDRPSATRISFFMAIPALTAAGLFQAVQEADQLDKFGVGPMAVGIVVAFVVAYASIAWLLKFVASNSLKSFVVYRVAFGVIVMGLLAANVLSAT